MAKTPSPLHAKRIPNSVSKPTETAEAAATLAETVVAAPAAKRAAKKAKPAAPVARASKAVKSVARPAPAVPVLSGTAKAHKPKLVRDSFTMPKDEYQVIDVLKRRALALEKQVRKSELLRAGIQALAALNDRAFLKAIAGVPTLKTGRPKAD
jgi:hypothetical protein